MVTDDKREELKAAGRELLEAGVARTQGALMERPGQRRDQALAAASHHFIAAIGIAMAMEGHGPFARFTDEEPGDDA